MTSVVDGRVFVLAARVMTILPEGFAALRCLEEYTSGFAFPSPAIYVDGDA